MFNFDDVIKEEAKQHNSNSPQILVHPYILISEWSGYKKTRSLFSLISLQQDIYKIYLRSKQSKILIFN